jgi:hypothetical protein
LWPHAEITRPHCRRRIIGIRCRNATPQVQGQSKLPPQRGCLQTNLCNSIELEYDNWRLHAIFMCFVIMGTMTKLLEEAIEHLRDLPEEEQDSAAEALFAFISSDERQYRLLPHQVTEVRRIQRGLQDGTTRLATDQEVERARKRARI